MPMNGIHDMGGMHGFGKVHVEPNEPVFHERWEARVFGMVQSLRGNIDAGRHAIERLDPVAYLQNGYYGRWLAAFERSLIGLGVLRPIELEERMREAPHVAPQSEARKTSSWRPASRSHVRKVDSRPAFSCGQMVVTRNHQPAGHTRLPAYARCRRGTIQRVHPAMVFPDDHAHDRGENPQHLYTVKFSGEELWGDAAEPGTFVHLDLFESYLNSANGEGS